MNLHVMLKALFQTEEVCRTADWVMENGLQLQILHTFIWYAQQTWNAEYMLGEKVHNFSDSPDWVPPDNMERASCEASFKEFKTRRDLLFAVLSHLFEHCPCGCLHEKVKIASNCDKCIWGLILPDTTYNDLY